MSKKLKDTKSRNSRDRESNTKRNIPSTTTSVQNILQKNEYVVEAIVGKKYYHGKPMYLVKWENYPSTDNTWEPLEHLKRVPDLVQRFELNRRNRGLKLEKPQLVESPKVTSTSDDRKDDEESEIPKSAEAGETHDKTLEDSDYGSEGMADLDALEVYDECPTDKIPIKVHGCTRFDNIGGLVFLVQWKKQKKTEQPLAEDIDMPNDVEDFRLIRSEALRYKFPEVLIEFYEQHVTFVCSTESAAEQLRRINAMVEAHEMNTCEEGDIGSGEMDVNNFDDLIKISDNDSIQIKPGQKAFVLSPGHSETEIESGSDDDLRMHVDPTVC